MKRITPLTDLDRRRLRPDPQSKTPPRIRDGGGLYLEALADRKVWRMKYKRPNGKETRATFGDYPTVTLAEARKRRDEARELIRQGIDPNQSAAQELRARQAAHLATFEVVSSEWIEHKAPNWSPAQKGKVEGIVKRVLLAWLGKRPIAEIAAPEILDCLQRYERQGKLETAHRARAYASNVFRRGIQLGVCTTDPAQMLEGALMPVRSKNFAHITDIDQFGKLLVAIDSYNGSFVVQRALQLSPMLAQRPGEIRQMAWSEVDLEAALWHIPAERMKARRPHTVPLPEQAAEILKVHRPYTEATGLVFPGARDPRTPMSGQALLNALKRMGFPGHVMTAHGFRHTVSTMLNEQGWHPDVIERQLAHQDSNSIRATYNKAEYLDERREMMQAWANYLDSIKRGGKVTPIKRKRA